MDTVSFTLPPVSCCQDWGPCLAETSLSPQTPSPWHWCMVVLCPPPLVHCPSAPQASQPLWGMARHPQPRAQRAACSQAGQAFLGG